MANTAHWPKGAIGLPLCITGSTTDIKQDSSQDKSKDLGKRVLSPNSSSTQAQFNRAEKRICHNQEMSGPSIYSSLPTHKTARSSVPRKPALPSFSSTTTISKRSSSAPKTRPVVQERRYNFHRKKSQINQENMNGTDLYTFIFIFGLQQDQENERSRCFEH